MKHLRASRRSIVAASAVVSAWLASPLRGAMVGLPDARTKRRIDDLIAAMTPGEKAGQLTLNPAAWAGGAAISLNPPTGTGTFDEQLAEVRAGRLTGVFNGNGAAMARRMQDVAVNEARHRIPLLFAADVIHGLRTVFPTPLGEAASFDATLAYDTARAAAVEAAASGIDWTFAPMVDIARDQRWGRGVEGAGEDVLLGRIMAEARVKGFHGTNGLAAADAVATCAKHLVAYGAAEAGLDYNSVDVSERTLREVYFPPFQAALGAGASGVMPAFNELSGVPATANRWLLDEVLRKEWGFDGVVVSDYTADAEMIAHGYAADGRDAARLAFLAGVDICLVSNLYRDHLPDLVAKGDVPMARLDAAVRRVLAFKAQLGLFDDPYRRISIEREKTAVRTPAALALARSAGSRSIVMLKNDGDLLPLPRAGKRIALIGPFSSGKRDLVGPWNVYGTDAEAIDLETAVRAAVAGGPVSVTRGSDVSAPIAGGIDAAVAAAKAADIVVLTLGESQDMSGEAQSRSDIGIPAAQMALADAVIATGKPVVVLLRCGRALALAGAPLEARSMLVTWFLGSQDGHAIADVLFGTVAPSARLPVSFPHATGQQPYYYAHKRTGRPNGRGPLKPYTTHFREFANTALFPFGHGLTYGRIVYEALDLGTARLSADAPLKVRARIANRGPREATEVVQLYVQDVTASVTRPVQELKAFQRVTLRPGEVRHVDFTLRREDLSFVGVGNRAVVEPGRFLIWVAPSAEVDGVNGAFELV